MQAPQAATAEDQLLVQFQGMIAEYERAQILERSRRGKRHRAREGQVSVLSGAPFGYRYVRKSDDAAARYEINHAEADIVRTVYEPLRWCRHEHRRHHAPAEWALSRPAGRSRVGSAPRWGDITPPSL